MKDCKLQKAIKPIMLIKNKNDMIKFCNYKNRFEHPYVIYIDFECMLENIYDGNNKWI